MRRPRYLGLALGVIATLSLATAVAAGTITNSVTNQPMGWNSEIFVKASTGNISYQINYCRRVDGTSTAAYDLMHHWFGLPSTGTQTVNYKCQNNSTVWNYTWGNRAAADYSIEYRGPSYFCGKFCSNDTRASWSYKIIY